MVKRANKIFYQSGVGKLRGIAKGNQGRLVHKGRSFGNLLLLALVRVLNFLRFLSVAQYNVFRLDVKGQ